MASIQYIRDAAITISDPGLAICPGTSPARGLSQADQQRRRLLEAVLDQALSPMLAAS